MIPILFDKDEVGFATNGLGRLRDCISCIVTEERNGIYECDFEYPVSGAHYDMIQIGRIICVTHDDSDDLQPFDIVSYTKPIDGVVTFHCVHISYRQSYMVVTGTNINSLADAFTLFSNASPQPNPFIYKTNKTSTGYLGSADGVTKTVRSMLGGIEGSVLDAYGGEYEWDRWTVNLWTARGQQRDFTIRYGVNMLTYDEECDSSGCYSSCVPYWTDGTTTVVGDKQVSGSITPSGREQIIPLDVSEKFEEQPTKAQVEAMGLSVMNGQNPTIPSQNITVSFARLQDMGYSDYDKLLQCRLCDTINVVFPFYDVTERFKIVKTEWNVLRDKYESMELGDLSVSLSEALGITQDSSTKLSTGLPTGYGTAVDISSYTSSSNTYTVPNNGFVRLEGNYRNGSYIMLYVDGTIFGEATGANTGANIVISIPVFKGQSLYITRSNNYCFASFYPFTTS